MNKKIIAFLLAAVMVLALCACGASAAKDVAGPSQPIDKGNFF